ncbi:NTP transferase domain-containing protein [bacterium]|nr:NTP transferase domain-containing protein [bacterium]
MKAMIFAAGFGKRLLPLTENTPKALIQVQNRPMLDWIIDNLIQSGIKDIIINTHHLAPRIVSFLKEKQYPVSVKTSHEETILGTGGGLFNTKNFWNTNDFFVCNADILCNADLRIFHDHHKNRGSLVSLGINNRISKSMLLVDEKGYLVGNQKNGKREIIRTPHGEVQCFGFCGFHMISPKIFSYIDHPVEFSIIDEYFKIVRLGVPISTWHINDAYWEDIGTLEALRSANREFPGFSHVSS